MQGLATVTGMTPAEIEQEIEQVRKESPASPVILRRGLGAGKVFFLRENQARFPGVDGRAGLRARVQAGRDRARTCSGTSAR